MMGGGHRETGEAAQSDEPAAAAGEAGGEGGHGKRTTLGLRLGVMMLIALLPLGLLSLTLTRSFLDQATISRSLATLGEARRIAARDLDGIITAREAAAAHAKALTLIGRDADVCHQFLDNVLHAAPGRRMVAYVSRDGVARCATERAGEALSSIFSLDKPLMPDRPQILLAATARGQEPSLLLVTYPVQDKAGLPAGAVAIAIVRPVLPIMTEASGLFPGVRKLLSLVVYDASGTQLVKSEGMGPEQEFLPEGVRLDALADDEQLSFVARDATGTERLFTMIGLDGGLKLIGTWEIGRSTLLLDLGLHPFALAMVIWFAGVALALFGVERLVLRHLRRLSAAMRDFGGGKAKAMELKLDDPPQEIARLEDVYRTMTETILRDQAEQENLIRQKEMLLREVHHRTGNSLQLIASILRMHRREATDPHTIALLDTLHERVISLSSVHLGLYRLAGDADIEIAGLLSEVMSKVSAVHSQFGRRTVIRADLEPMTLTADQAVPLALLLTELLSCGLVAETEPAAGAAEREALRWGSEWRPVLVTLVRVGANRAQLTMTLPAAARPVLTGEHENAPTVISFRLIAGFLQQLHAELQIGSSTRTIPSAGGNTGEPEAATAPLVTVEELNVRVGFVTRIASPSGEEEREKNNANVVELEADDSVAGSSSVRDCPASDRFHTRPFVS